MLTPAHSLFHNAVVDFILHSCPSLPLRRGQRLILAHQPRWHLRLRQLVRFLSCLLCCVRLSLSMASDCSGFCVAADYSFCRFDLESRVVTLSSAASHRQPSTRTAAPPSSLSFPSFLPTPHPTPIPLAGGPTTCTTQSPHSCTASCGRTTWATACQPWAGRPSPR